MSCHASLAPKHNLIEMYLSIWEKLLTFRWCTCWLGWQASINISRVSEKVWHTYSFEHKCKSPEYLIMIHDHMNHCCYTFQFGMQVYPKHNHCLSFNFYSLENIIFWLETVKSWLSIELIIVHWIEVSWSMLQDTVQDCMYRDVFTSWTETRIKRNHGNWV